MTHSNIIQPQDATDLATGLASLSTGDLVYSGLKQRILGHELEMGAPLREEDVANWFESSRAPARDALRRLEQEGLVVRNGRRYAIRSFTYHEVMITYRQRAALEFLAVEYAVKRGQAALAPVEAILEQQKLAFAAATRSQFSQLDRAFHLALAELSGQPLLVNELSIILDRVQLLRTTELRRDAGPQGAYLDHCRIFDALKRGQASIAQAELEYHYATTVRLHADLDTAEVTTPPEMR
ncbi:hypothetical protein DKP76_04350 [Falsochrobactrum shanghaiense]|uniref:GntR family transcriptional regulator n=1 Tax=Falsochrobactrum shanghaiense TaxID=2201899 RepID=A0A316JAR8_9HYPH|nr:GntR family transcriptional regulator [Falsochrobactrum shanghaiense]PWL18341.1 hypothetical protein DKP76_04350 [Falsochrobactrum shanghaiense]